MKPLLLGRQVVLCRHEQDGDVFIDPPHRFCKRKTVCFRHHNVRDNQLVKVVIHLFVCVVGVQAALCLKPAVIQIGANRLVQLCIIFQNKNVHHIPSHSRQTCQGPNGHACPAARFLYYTTAPICCGLLFQPFQVLCCANHHIYGHSQHHAAYGPACSGIHHAPEHG